MTDALPSNDDLRPSAEDSPDTNDSGPQPTRHKPTLHLPPQVGDSRQVARHAKVRKVLSTALESDSGTSHAFA